jgi:hypothetical protein
MKKAAPKKKPTKPFKPHQPIPLSVLATAAQQAKDAGRTEDFIAALIRAGAEVAQETAVASKTNPGRCQCETQGWQVWDWQYWMYDCWTPRPPECDWM